MTKSGIKALPVFLCGGLLFVQLAAASSERTWVPGRVVQVVDGDTIKFQPDDLTVSAKPMSIRMLLIDTPETKLPGPGGPHSQGRWGDAATEYLKSLVRPGDSVEIESFGIDRLYHRMVGKVWRSGVDINFEMLKSGWATLYVYCNGEDECYSEPEYLEACNEAVRNGQGVFNPIDPLPEIPFVFRANATRTPILEFVGDRKERFFVSPERWAEIPLCDRIFFVSPDAARLEGFILK